VTELLVPSLRASPFQGLRIYNGEDAFFFFGRDHERDVVIANLRASRLTVLYGPSGVGKSSLLRAGVQATLERAAARNHAQFGTPEFVPVVFSAWQGEPCEDLSAAIVAAVRRLTGEPLDPAASLIDTIRSAAGTAEASLLIILDQFEELTLYPRGQLKAGAFDEVFPVLVNDRSLPVSFLVAIREDALAQLDRFRAGIPMLLDSRLRVNPLSGESARAAIIGPVDHYNQLSEADQRVEVEAGLVNAVLNQVRTGRILFEQEGHGRLAGAEDAEDGRFRGQIEAPYLQLVMSAVWAREMEKQSRVLRQATLVELGGAKEIVRGHLDVVLADLLPEEREIAVDVFHQLVTPSGTKIAHTIGDLAAYTGHSRAAVQALVEKLTSGEQRIVRPVPAPEGEDGDLRVEIFHDALAPAIAGWRTRQGAIRLEHQKREAEGRARREHHRAQVLLGVTAGAIVLLVLAGVAVAFALVQRSRADAARATAESGRLAAVASADASSDYQGRALTPGLLLAMEAYRISRAAETRNVLVDGLALTEGMAGYLRTQGGAINGVAFDPQGAWLASGSVDGTVALWDFETGQTRTLLSGPSVINGVTFSPDGGIVASADEDGRVILSEVATPNRRLPLNGHAGPVYGVAFDPTRNIVASADADGSVILWNAATGRRLGTLHDHEGPVNGVVFDRAGDELATADDRGTITIWNPVTGHRLRTIRTGSSVNGVAFNPAGTIVASAESNGTAMLWQVASRRQLSILSAGDGSAIESVAFSPDGATVVTGGADDNVRTWDITNGALIRTYEGQTGTVETVAFGPGGTIASGSADRSVVLWSTSPGTGATSLSTGATDPIGIAFGTGGNTLAAGYQNGDIGFWNLRSLRQQILPAGIGPVNGIAFDRDGGELAGAGADGSAAIWNPLTGRRELRASAGRGNPLNAVALRPDGNILAAAAQSGQVFLWNRAGTLMHELSGHSGAVESVAFSPDGKTLASGGADGNIILSDPTTGATIRILTGQTATVESLAFSPTGRMLASASDDDTVVLWNPRTGRQLGQPLIGHQAGVDAVAFSPNGRTLASGSADHTVIVWNLSTRLGQPLGGHSDTVTSVAYSADGGLFASASLDGTILVYRRLPGVNIRDIDQRLCSLVRSNLTITQSSEFLPDKPYQKICPGYPSGGSPTG
jgi:WD40 repeat protein